MRRSALREDRCGAISRSARALARAVRTVGGEVSVVAALFALPALSQSSQIPLPSGRTVTFHDTIWGAPGVAGLTIRFRFLEADLAAVVAAGPYAELEADMHFLCETYAIDRIANTGPQPAQIVISISDRPVEFGVQDPDATQVFEAYRPEDGACIWEGF